MAKKYLKRRGFDSRDNEIQSIQPGSAKNEGLALASSSRTAFTFQRRDEGRRHGYAPRSDRGRDNEPRFVGSCKELACRFGKAPSNLVVLPSILKRLGEFRHFKTFILNHQHRKHD